MQDVHGSVRQNKRWRLTRTERRLRTAGAFVGQEKPSAPRSPFHPRERSSTTTLGGGDGRVRSPGRPARAPHRQSLQRHVQPGVHRPESMIARRSFAFQSNLQRAHPPAGAPNGDPSNAALTNRQGLAVACGADAIGGIGTARSARRERHCLRCDAGLRGADPSTKGGLPERRPFRARPRRVRQFEGRGVSLERASVQFRWSSVSKTSPVNRTSAFRPATPGA